MKYEKKNLQSPIQARDWRVGEQNIEEKTNTSQNI